jgi:hypothetical protein
VRQVFNIVFVHLLNKTEHSPDCTVRPGLGLVCDDKCQTAEFLERLDGPLFPWEVREAQRLHERRAAFLRGEIPT